jgi:ABC-type phosphate/phosphonate transport system substrate-binding protein
MLCHQLRRFAYATALACLAAACLVGCGPSREGAVIGTKKHPLELAVPAAEKATPLADFVRERTGLRCREVPAESLNELLDLLEDERPDVLIVSAPVYALLSDPCNLLAILKAERAGTLETRGMILARADRGLVTVADAKGLTVAAVDPASVSGCLLQRILLSEEKATPSAVTYLDDEAAVVRAVYYGEADLGLVTWSVNDEGNPDDARAEVFYNTPDIFQAVVPLAVTRAVPHDAVAVRARVPDVLRGALAAALLEFAQSSEGRSYLAEHYGIDGLVPSDDAEYAELRTRLKEAGVTLTELLPEEED